MVNLINKVSSFFDRILESLDFVARILVLLIMLGITSEVITRYFLRKPIPGVIDVTETMILWIVFLGAAWLLKKDGHVRMEIVVNQLKPEIQNWLNVVAHIIGAAVCFVLVLGEVIGLD